MIRMFFRKRIKVPPEMVANYRAALISGLESAPESERALYEIHLSALDELEKSLALKENVEETALQIWGERRSHGWSYLSGQEGSLVTGLFHEMATLVENQIFRIKGKEWYYSL